METLRYHVQPSPFGPVAIVWWDRGGIPLVRRILLPSPNTAAVTLAGREFPGSTRRSCPEIDRLGRDVRDFLSGRPVEFEVHLIDLSRCPAFQRHVLLAEAGIPRGWTSTYGRIARHVGRPRAARAVGRALSCNPFPVVIPCHRAIRQGGELGGFQGGVEMKRALLRYEGVRFSPEGRVVPERIYY